MGDVNDTIYTFSAGELSRLFDVYYHRIWWAKGKMTLESKTEVIHGRFHTSTPMLRYVIYPGAPSHNMVLIIIF